MRFLTWLLLIFMPVAAEAATPPPLQGDAEAVRRIELMYRQLGGRERWAAAQSMTIHYRQLSSLNRPGEGPEYAWRDLTRPRERLEWVRTDANGTKISFGRGNDEQRGWRRRPDGQVVETPADQLQAELKFWERDFYTMFKRMAAGDPTIRFSYTAPNRIVMTDPTGAELGWWEIDNAGWLLRWGTTDGDGEAFDWWYGPYKQYGDISFPAWGVSTKFLIRFEYLDFRISTKPFPEEVLSDPLTPPSSKLLLR